MALILAIEPDRTQAARLTSLVRTRLQAELVLADTTEDALMEIGDRVPDLVLVPALLSPQEDAAVAGALRVIAAAARVQMLTIPVLADAEAAPKPRGMLAKLRRRPERPPDGCDPAVFGDQIAAYLADAEAARAAEEAEMEEMEAEEELTPPVLDEEAAGQPLIMKSIVVRPLEAAPAVEQPIDAAPTPVPEPRADIISAPPAIEPPLSIILPEPIVIAEPPPVIASRERIDHSSSELVDQVLFEEPATSTSTPWIVDALEPPVAAASPESLDEAPVYESVLLPVAEGEPTPAEASSDLAFTQDFEEMLAAATVARQQPSFHVPAAYEAAADARAVYEPAANDAPADVPQLDEAHFETSLKQFADEPPAPVEAAEEAVASIAASEQPADEPITVIATAAKAPVEPSVTEAIESLMAAPEAPVAAAPVEPLELPAVAAADTTPFEPIELPAMYATETVLFEPLELATIPPFEPIEVTTSEPIPTSSVEPRAVEEMESLEIAELEPIEAAAFERNETVAAVEQIAASEPFDAVEAFEQVAAFEQFEAVAAFEHVAAFEQIETAAAFEPIDAVAPASVEADAIEVATAPLVAPIAEPAAPAAAEPAISTAVVPAPEAAEPVFTPRALPAFDDLIAEAAIVDAELTVVVDEPSVYELSLATLAIEAPVVEALIAPVLGELVPPAQSRRSAGESRREPWPVTETPMAASATPKPVPETPRAPEVVREPAAAAFLSQSDLDMLFFADANYAGPPIEKFIPQPPPAPAPPPAPEPVAVAAAPERPDWVELIESLRADIARLRAERSQPADAPALPPAPVPLPPPAPLARAWPPAEITMPARKRRRQSRPKLPKPIQDQWGLFDPEQCGFAALLSKLDEISRDRDGEVEFETTERVISIAERRTSARLQ